MIRYNKLFALLALRDLKKTDLLEIIASPTLAKLSKGEIVKTDIIDRLCLYLSCQPSDIMEVIDPYESADDKTVYGKSWMIGNENDNKTYVHDIYVEENNQEILIQQDTDF